MSEVDLKTVRKRHVLGLGKGCRYCAQLMPCDAIQLADEIERLRRELEWARGGSGEIDTEVVGDE